MDFGSFAAFGHDGAGGALGSYDPTYDLAFGDVPQQVELAASAAAPIALSLTQVARDCTLNAR